MLMASCSNCASWVSNPAASAVPASANPSVLPLLNADGACTRALAPPQGELLCSQYQISKAFAQRLASIMMKDEHFVMKAPLPGKTAREARQRNRRG